MLPTYKVKKHSAKKISPVEDNAIEDLAK
jgi:hypothetical protein